MHEKDLITLIMQIIHCKRSFLCTARKVFLQRMNEADNAGNPLRLKHALPHSVWMLKGVSDFLKFSSFSFNIQIQFLLNTTSYSSEL